MKKLTNFTQLHNIFNIKLFILTIIHKYAISTLSLIISIILYSLSREPANPGTILEMGDTVVSLRTSTLNHTNKLAGEILIELPVNFTSFPSTINSSSSSLRYDVNATCVFWDDNFQ